MTSDTETPEMDSLWEELSNAMQQGQAPEAKAVLKRIDTLADKMISDGDIKGEGHKSAMLFESGNIAVVEGRPQDAVTSYKAAIPHATRLLSERPSVKARALMGSLHYNLGTYYCDTNRLDDAEKALVTAVSHQEVNINESEEPKLKNQLAQTRFNLGNVYMAKQRQQEAAICFITARNLWQALVNDFPDAHEHAHNLARSHFNFSFVAGPTVEANDAFEQAQAIWEGLVEKLTDEVEPRCDISRCYFNHSVFLVQMGRHEIALEKMERALVHMARLIELSPNEPSFKELQRQAIEEEKFLREFQPAKVVAENLAGLNQIAMSAREEKDWEKLKEVGLGHIQLARNLGQAFRPVEMEQVTRAGIQVIAELAARDPKQLENAQLEPAIFYDLHNDLKALGKFDAAEEALRTALHRWEQLNKQHKDNHLFQHWLAEAHNNIGIICMDTGRSFAAISAYKTALSMREKMSKTGLLNIGTKDPENKVSLGGIQCNIGSTYLNIGDLSNASEFFSQAVKTMESVRGMKVRKEILDQFLANANNGLAQCKTRKPIDRSRFKTAALTWTQPGPPALNFDVSDPALALALKNADELRLRGRPSKPETTSEPPERDQAIDRATEKLVEIAPDSAEAWLLHGLVMGDFLTEEGGEPVQWLEERHEAATNAFYKALVLRPDYFEAKLYKGMALRQAAHASQASLNNIDSFITSVPEEEREGFVTPVLIRFSADLARATESLEAAARLRPEDGRPLFELAELFNGLGLTPQAQPYLKKLESLDKQLYERFQERLN